MIRIIACGSVKEKWMQAGILEYAHRLRAYEKLEIVEVEDEPAPPSNSLAENVRVLEKEGMRLWKRIGAKDFVILLDLKGKEMDSIQLSKMIDQCMTNGKSRIAFVIGGSLGVSKALIQRSDIRWKLSVNTFPHQLCRLLVLEQVYRAFRILHHEPYHK